MVETKKGNIFTTTTQTIVNTINCVGVMGAGIAYEFKLRFPKMFDKYKHFCSNKSMAIGNLWIYKLTKDDNKWIHKYTNSNNKHYQYVLNFPTKKHWKYPTKIEYLEKGLQKLLTTYKQRKITSIAFPLLGVDQGGLDEKQSIKVMTKYLEQLNIPVQIWHFDPNAKDDLYEYFKDKFLNLDTRIIKKHSKLRINYIRKIKIALKQRSDINNLGGLLRVKGIGAKSIEKSFYFIKNYENTTKPKITATRDENHSNLGE